MTTDKQKLFETIGLELDKIDNKNIKDAFIALFNIIEENAKVINILKEENQKLRDEINRLKGEQGKPDIKPKNKNISSEKERKKQKRKKKKKKKKGSKKDRLKIDKIEYCEVDKNILPEDAEFKGYTDSYIQDIIILTNNILFKKEVFYSSSMKKTYIGKIPQGYEGGFGPNIKALVIILKNVCNMSEPKILDFLHSCKIEISSATISNILIKKKSVFHKEKDEIFISGLNSTMWQQTDDTSARVNGENWYTHIFCNPLYTAYFTCKRKNRLTILELLLTGKDSEGQGLKYCFNDETFSLLEQLKVSKKIIDELKTKGLSGKMSKDEIDLSLERYFPDLSERVRNKILEACAIASYHNVENYPVVKILMSDDAPQFKLLTFLLALCWIHDGRHYKKLNPIIPFNQKKLEEFIKKYWEYYNKLLDYKKNPDKETAKHLSKEFDVLFSTKTGYDDLDERILKTKKKKDNLLLVLRFPELPLHNNESELAARVSVRKRDVSLHTITDDGTKANDTFLTIIQTCKKLGINSFDFILDRILKVFEIPRLADVIQQKSNI